jgi:hypothetical protein
MVVHRKHESCQELNAIPVFAPPCPPRQPIFCPHLSVFDDADREELVAQYQSMLIGLDAHMRSEVRENLPVVPARNPMGSKRKEAQ